MKRFKLITLLLLVCMFTATAFAVAGDEQKALGLQQVQRLTDAELRTGIPMSGDVVVDPMSATPKPTALLKGENMATLAAPVGPYSGPYTIPGDFASITEAVILVNSYGLAGPTEFILGSASYTENGVTFGSYTGNATHTLTVKPAAATAVTINFTTTTTTGKGFAFNNAKNIIIDGLNTGGAALTLQYATGFPFPTSDAFAATIYVTGGSSNITVQNVNIKGNIQTAGTFFDQTAGRPAVFVFRSSTGAANTNITVTKCTITNATFGLKALTQTFGNTQGPIWYTYNNVGGAFGGMVMHGAIVDQVFGIHYDYNVLDGIEFVPEYWNNGTTEYDVVTTFAGPYNTFLYDFGQHSAGHFYNYDAASTISYNYIKDVHQNVDDPGFQFNCYGLLVRVGSGAKVINNRITGIATIDANGIIVGLRNEAQAWHNSIWLKPTDPPMLAGQTSYCMRAAGGTTYNNAFSNELGGGTAATKRALSGTPAGGSEGNAMFSLGNISTQATGWQYVVATGKDAGSAFGPIYFTPDLHVDFTQPTYASNTGEGTLTAPSIVDIDTDPRHATTPDAGADEFGDAPVSLVDVFPTVITAPTSAGVPSGVSHAVIVNVKNNSTDAAVTDLLVTISGPEGYSETIIGVSLNPSEGKAITLPSWTPQVGGGSPRTITATTSLADAVPANNVTSRSQIVADPIPITANTCFDFDASAQGWTAQTGPPNTSATTDWVRSSTFTKLGGVYGGAGASWVTRRPIAGADHNANYTQGGYANTEGYTTTYPGPNLLISPFWNISGLSGTDLYISFVHSIQTEPKWDFSMLQYTTDGVSWNVVGTKDDPNGITWYSSSMYSTPTSGPYDTYHCIHQAAWEDMYGLGTIPTNGYPSWSSKGDCDLGTITGPAGWVFTQIRIPVATNPWARANVIRFRYLAFADGFTADAGWAFDNFCIGNSGASFTGGFINGNVFHDLNGNGINDDASPNVGDSVTLSYFGAYIASTQTDASGNYSFNLLALNNGLPGVYNVQLHKPGYAFTLPFGTTSIYNVNHPGDGSTITRDFGKYQGFVSGVKFSDLDDDGQDKETTPLEPGLGGWTIEMHKDSANGPLIGSAVTAANGTYTILAPAYFWGGTNPGNYVVKEIAQPTKARQTFPVAPGTHTIQVTGTSGPGNIIANKNFGNFIFAEIKCEATQDRDGDGVREPLDGYPLPEGTDRVYIDVFKDQVKIATDELGDGVGFVLHRTLDKGTYGFKRITETATTGWIETMHQDSFTVVIDAGGMTPSVSYLYFKLITITGIKFDDKDGSGSLTTGDVGAGGWTINVSGTVYGPSFAVTEGDGNYTITGVGPGMHTISETMLTTDWIQTFPTPATYTFEAITASQTGGNQVNKNFGNFKKFCVSGIKFRDRNCDGIQDAGEEPLADWTINLTGKTPIVTGVDGAFSWCGLLPGNYTLSETPQDGWTSSTPTGGTITFDAVSGFDRVVPFGNCKATDNIKYRTFTYEQLSSCTVPANNQKVLKAPSMKAPATKPWYAIPLMTVVNQLLKTELAVLRVGETGIMYPWGKVAPYLEPAKYSDVSKTFVDCKVARVHIGAPQPFNYTGKGGIMAKRYKSIPPKTDDNMLTAELLTLQVNLALSDKGNTPTGLGAVVYPGTGPWGTNKPIDDIEAYANKIMTNWVPGMVTPSPVNPTDYDALYNAVRAINLAFASTSVVDTTTDGGWRAPKFIYVGIKTAPEAGFLAPTAAPKARPVGTPDVTPDAYALGQNYPNPFNPTTTLSFDLPKDAVVTLKIYNLLGQEVATILDRQEYSSGTYEESFDASKLASGVYLYRIVSEEISDDGSTGQSFMQVKKMVLMK